MWLGKSHLENAAEKVVCCQYKNWKMRNFDSFRISATSNTV